MLHRDLTENIIGAAIEVHRHLGPGCLESTYERCLCHELSLRGSRYERQLKLPVVYKGLSLPTGYRIDLLIESAVVVEIKAIDTVLPVHEAQLITYLRLSGHHVGLLINFHVPALKDGIIRRIL